MSSIFTKIINGEIPGRFVYRDEKAVAFLDIAPQVPGHVLVVPVAEVNKWTDLDADTWAHLTAVAQKVGQAVIEVFGSERASFIIAGFDVPHTHIHVFPANSMEGYNLAAKATVTDADMDEIQEKLTAALQ
ncbi:MAG: HIT family protein [Corynebacterium sp.]|nr:HIT family protein [Corynebacterium sp.]